MSTSPRRHARDALLRARIPFKGPAVRTLFRGYERFLALKARSTGDLQDQGIPLPPPQLRVLVAGTADPEWFIRSGRTQVNYLRDLIERHGRPAADMDAILDFGCGCGRMLRWWSDLPDGVVHGCDYNAELTRWCESNLALGRYRNTNLTPPLPYDDQQFDFVYALSVFTHLTLELTQDWLSEIARITKPGALFWFTVHGESYTDRLLPDEDAMFRGGLAVVHFPEVEGTNLCSVYWPEDAVLKVLGERFEVLHHFDPGEDPAAAASALLQHDAYLVRRL